MSPVRLEQAPRPPAARAPGSAAGRRLFDVGDEQNAFFDLACDDFGHRAVGEPDLHLDRRLGFAVVRRRRAPDDAFVGGELLAAALLFLAAEVRWRTKAQRRVR